MCFLQTKYLQRLKGATHVVQLLDSTICKFRGHEYHAILISPFVQRLTPDIGLEDFVQVRVIVPAVAQLVRLLPFQWLLWWQGKSPHQAQVLEQVRLTFAARRRVLTLC